jgi:hypothetical protein
LVIFFLLINKIVMNEIEFSISRIIISNTKHAKNSTFVLHNNRGTITFYVRDQTHYTSVKIVNEIKIDHAKNIVYVIYCRKPFN